MLRPDEALLERGFVFGEDRPFAQCHASTLVETRDGRLVVAFFAGPYEGHPDVAIWTAEGRVDGSSGSSGAPPKAAHGSTVFAPPRRAVKVRDVAHWNPVLYRLDGAHAGDDVLALQFKVGDRIRTWETWIARSFDGGRRFEGAMPLVPGDRGGRGAVRNKPIRLASGDWLAGASIEAWRRWDAFFDRSPDGVGGWIATKRIDLDRARFRGKGLIQPALWESKPGHVHALFRTTDGRIHQSDSDDDGRRWSRARPTRVPNNNSALDLARLDDGTLALACNPVPGNWAARTPLSLLFSRDEGETWPFRLDVETGPGEFSYPAVVASGGGLALCYTWNRRRIAFVRIPSARGLLETGTAPAAGGAP
ncbi:MAG: exo-alpha-sialidase [Deltaproteobacteria bacterium]|nr:exo-alpha-sialidase [Deltaproteobacteria bacterium]